MVGLYIFIGIVVVALIGFGAYVLYRKKIDAENLAIADADLERIKEKHDDFIAAVDMLKAHGFVRKAHISLVRAEWLPVYNEFNRTNYHAQSESCRLVNDFIQLYDKLEMSIERWNAEFVIKEKERCNGLLSDIDGKSLDEQQRDVVVYDEDNTLVLAGAGSGKTLTIAGKVKYLCSEKKVKPEEILLISFTRKAADEMTERIGNRLGIPVNATTFHKLGLDIIKQATNESPDVLENISQFVSKYFEGELTKQPETVKMLIEYFAYYLHIPADMGKFECLGDAYAYERGMDFETIKSKYDKSQLVRTAEETHKTEKRTLQGEKVRSLEEVSIANFLFLNGVRYEYEAKYPFQSGDANYKVYRPDFYLPDYNLYIEHFGIDRNGRLPWLTPIEEKKYLDGMAWKRGYHRANSTKLLETYSYYSSDGVLLEKLEEMLRQNGVELRDIDYKQIFDAIYASESDTYFSEFKKLCETFIVLFKSNGYKVDEVSRLQTRNPVYKNAYFQRRVTLFRGLIKPLLEGYEKFLTDNQMIDFSDMINKAADAVKDGFAVSPYKYVIIDEYQDISVARYKLVRAILDQTRARLLCVGDDWQSIYRFAGSDISLFTEFEKYYEGKCLIMRLERTYRNSQELINAAGKFVQSNPRQMQKQLASSKSIEKPIIFWMYDANPFISLRNAIENILKRYDAKQSILLLGRTRYDSSMLEASGLFDMRKGSDKLVYKGSPETPITFLTVHKAKGLEADNVILLNFQNSLLGFPNKIADDPMLELVLSDSDDYLFAEERRLFYVAMTRTKNRFIVLTDSGKPSAFFKEFEESENALVYSSDTSGNGMSEVSCPRCKSGKLVVRKNEEENRYFLGCSNYPQCDYTYHNVGVLAKNHRCPECGGFLVLREGKFGKFFGCSNYPLCTRTVEAEYSTESNELEPAKGNYRRRIGF